MALRDAIERYLNSDGLGPWLPLTAVLSPLACVNASLQRARRERYRSAPGKSFRPAVPTICVGNITLGGTGKTPLVEEVCALLQELGVTPAVISRGYGGTLEGQCRAVSDGEKILLTAAEAGDEPVLLAHRLKGVPVIISARRSEGAKLAVEGLGAGALVLDDGYQHLKLARDLDIVVLDAARPFGNGRCLPAGTLREPPEALCDAGALILSRADALSAVELEKRARELRRYNTSAPIIHACHRLGGVIRWCDGTVEGLEWLRGRKVAAFAGIGKPETFFKQLEAAGAKVVQRMPFPDHHPYGVAELKALAEEAMRSGAEALVATEKDAVRIADPDKVGLPLMVATLKIDLKDEGREALQRLIEAALKSRKKT